MNAQITRPLAEAYAHVRSLVQFAYEHGFHELGYEPEKVLRAEIERLRVVADAARDLEETLAKLIEADETVLTSTDIGAAAIESRLNTLHKALELLP
jgi:hypothetical protein